MTPPEISPRDNQVSRGRSFRWYRLVTSRYWAVGMIIAYQRVISPLLGPRCKYYPSCSEYARQAVEHYGLIGGGVRAGWRLLRCNPFSDGGFDPVKSPTSKAATSTTAS